MLASSRWFLSHAVLETTVQAKHVTVYHLRERLAHDKLRKAQDVADSNHPVLGYFHRNEVNNFARFLSRSCALHAYPNRPRGWGDSPPVLRRGLDPEAEGVRPGRAATVGKSCWLTGIMAGTFANPGPRRQA